jgi:hypothetical protein
MTPRTARCGRASMAAAAANLPFINEAVLH